MFALLSRAASVADNGGPLARPLFGEKRKRRGEIDGEIKRRGRGETIFEKERKEGRMARVSGGPSARPNRPQ